MRVIHLMGADSFADPETSTTYEAGPDGVFDLPEHVGAHYVTRHAGMFRRESDHEAMLAAAKAETLANPQNTAPTLKALLERVTALEDKVAAWETFFGGGAPAQEKAPETSDPESPKAAAEPDKQPEPEPDTPDDGDDSDESDDGDEEPAGDKPLRKPTPRKTTAKRRN